MAAVIYWFRNDLRLHDNETLHQAMATGQLILFIYCFDPRQFQVLDIGIRKTGFLRYQFLCESLVDLRKSLKARGANLLILQGKPEEEIPELVKKHQATTVFFQKEIASEEVTVENRLQGNLDALSCTTEMIWGKTLYHIDDAPFSPTETPLTSKAFRLKLTKNADVRPLFETPDDFGETVRVRKWGKLPTPAELGFDKKEIQENLNPHLQGGEEAGLARLQEYTFETQQLTSYRWTRNRSLGMEYSSKFSPWMALGCLSPRKIYWEVKRYEKEIKKNVSTWWMIFEVVWRDYFKYTAMRFGHLMFAAGGIKQRETNWKYDKDLYDRWRLGQTGIPFVDAHMRELNATGFMSNRGRVNCASFLARDYEIDWRWGAAWFETQLLDYDVCSNWLNWNTQATEIWYTNPVHQGMKYDRKGDYVRSWISELEEVPGPVIQAPWLLTADEQKAFGATNYPAPYEIYKKWTRSINRIEKAYRKELEKETSDS